ncbi:hypothetical protein FA15DRAFT_706047 [Coprinopsis marcescibilis]|uniref:Cyclin-like domain-containing protein n=1 Tax=Coprinopsis marcescibilis TaxID=230819 RepID=A0A5C3KSL2_COPMA|nr:hypothetical protein FA15DRAFT_706047 [Coprinopsis marcescibilis]
MATDFWVSSHYRRWLVDRATLKLARQYDRDYVSEDDHLDFLAIFFANIITRLGKKLQLRQRVIATATVFFRRFYLKNLYCETDPFLVISACIYVAAKAEESPVHIKNVLAESRTLFSQHYGVKNFPTDNAKLAEVEFYLVDDLESDLIVYHPYRTLLALCKTGSTDESGTGEEGEEGEEEEVGEVSTSHNAGVGIDSGPRYWGTGEGKLILSKEALQIAWSIINDTYRSELCLLYPPHLIAIAALYLTFILHPPEQTRSDEDSKPQPRRSSRNNHDSKSRAESTKNPDPITFLSQLNVSLPLVATIAQEIISLYTLWDRYKEDASPDAPSSSLLSKSSSKAQTASRSSSQTDLTKALGTKGKARIVPVTSSSSDPIPIPVVVDLTRSTSSSTSTSDLDSEFHVANPSQPITTTFLVDMLSQMRYAKLMDVAHGGEGELLGLSPSAAASVVQTGGPLQIPHSASSQTSSASGMSVGMAPQYAINKVLERAMNYG